MKTPFYYYNIELLEQTLLSLQNAAGEIRVHYAIKANSNKRILRVISSYGFGADCVSGNEIRRALECGFPANKIVLAGVGKTDAEIELALQENIACIHVESLEELIWLNYLAAKMKKKPAIAFRINPDLNAGTHQHITTGKIENKFGLSPEDIERIPELMKKCKNLEFIGLHFHIGSQIRNMDVFARLAEIAQARVQEFRKLGLKCKYLNLGGGLGVNYQAPDQDLIPDFTTWINKLKGPFESDPDIELHCEPGRSVLAQCGTLVSKVLFTKSNQFKNFAIIDAGMNDLIRPALYGARHRIESSSRSSVKKHYDVVGPICESSDTFANEFELPELQRGDFVFIRSAGAYGETMASSYNLREMVHPVFSDEFTLAGLILQNQKEIAHLKNSCETDGFYGTNLHSKRLA